MQTNLEKILKILIITTLINAGIFLYSCTTKQHPLTFKNQIEVRNATELGMEQLFLEDHEKACFYFEQASKKNLDLFFSVMGNSVDYCF